MNSRNEEKRRSGSSVELRNIDALIAKEVYQIEEVFYDNVDELVDKDGNTIPFWSTNILCSWDLIKKLQEHHYIDIKWDAHSKDWLCRIIRNVLPIIDIKSTANTAPLAICKAVLEAI